MPSGKHIALNMTMVQEKFQATFKVWLAIQLILYKLYSQTSAKLSYEDDEDEKKKDAREYWDEKIATKLPEGQVFICKMFT